MPNKDTSSKRRTQLLKSQLLANFHSQKPMSQIEGPRRITSQSIHTEMKQYLGPLAPSYIYVQDIATLIYNNPDPNFLNGYWGLNRDTTILSNQILIIPDGTTLLVKFFSLTNNGIISIDGTIRGENNNSSTLSTNNGTINISSTGTAAFVDGTLINTGTINNKGLLMPQIAKIRGVIINQKGIINNSGEIRINVAILINSGGTINNTGIFNNNNSSFVYNNQNGVINNNGTYTYINASPASNGTLFNADGTGSCGIGYINGTMNVDGSNCP